ncbi:MAG: CBS domain-containing protein [Psychrosphaera sp.]|jgi:CBS domain-containing protein
MNRFVHLDYELEVKMKKLQLFNLDVTDNVVSPEQFDITDLKSPATTIFTDFKKHEALMVESDTSAEDALKLMLKTHVRMKIVVSDNDDFLGIISTNELTEQKILAQVSKSNSRKDVLVKDLMIPKYRLHAFDYDELKASSVADVLLALDNYKLRHCLVLDRSSHHIRGVISSSDIARKLKLNINLNLENTFSSIYQAAHAA